MGIPTIPPSTKIAPTIKYGDLVRSGPLNSIGVVVDVFCDLDPKNPWIKVHLTHPSQGYHWCKVETLTLIEKKEGDQKNDPPLNGANGGSGSL